MRLISCGFAIAALVAACGSTAVGEDAAGDAAVDVSGTDAAIDSDLPPTDAVQDAQVPDGIGNDLAPIDAANDTGWDAGPDIAPDTFNNGCCQDNSTCAKGSICIPGKDCVPAAPAGKCWFDSDCKSGKCENANVCPCTADCSFSYVFGTCSDNPGSCCGGDKGSCTSRSELHRQRPHLQAQRHSGRHLLDQRRLQSRDVRRRVGLPLRRRLRARRPDGHLRRQRRARRLLQHKRRRLRQRRVVRQRQLQAKKQAARRHVLERQRLRRRNLQRRQRLPVRRGLLCRRHARHLRLRPNQLHHRRPEQLWRLPDGHRLRLRRQNLRAGQRLRLCAQVQRGLSELGNLPEILRNLATRQLSVQPLRHRQRFVGVVRQHGDVAHLAPGMRHALAVQVQVGARLGKHRPKIRLAA